MFVDHERLCIYVRSLSNALYRWESLFFCSDSISAYLFTVINTSCCDTEKTHVKPVFRGSKIASHPKTFDPRAGTITPSVRPSKIIGSVPGNTGLKNQCLWRVARRITAIPGPAEYAKVQTASASFVGNPTRSAFNPSCPSSAMKCLIYGPGSPPSAL